MTESKGAPEDVGEPNGNTSDSKSNIAKSKSGWDGKLRVNKQAILSNPEALSDPEYSDEDAPLRGEIAADEGTMLRSVVAS